jgi:Protein of unknown function (DUF2628)
MALYAVHCATRAPADLARARFVKQGFRLWAFLFAPLWLLINRLWLGFGLWVAAAAVIGALAASGLITPGAASALDVLLALLFGCEGANLIDAKLNRSGLPEIAVAGGRGREDAERAFFNRVTAEAPAAVAAPVKAMPPGPRGGLGSGGNGVVGLFPEAGR